MIEKIIRSALLAGVLAVSGCLGKYDNTSLENNVYPKQETYKTAKSIRPDVIQRASVFVSFDQAKEMNQDNMSWTFEYRLMF